MREKSDSIGEKRRITLKLVNQAGADAFGVGRGDHCKGAYHRCNNPTPMDVTHQNNWNISSLRKTKIGDVIAAQVDF